ncbi:MAG TPA: hypothetical protein VJ724_03160 [Tahibacter sp.]|nr:hypothetical protein [Tahibacter sp.]
MSRRKGVFVYRVRFVVAALCASGAAAAHGDTGRGTEGGGVPAWVATLSTTRWTELPTPVFDAWVRANLVPASGYYGSNPVGSVRDAYSNPLFDPAGKTYYLAGGGHNDGSLNAVFKFDAATLTYGIAVPPTPPSAYPPAFNTTQAAIVYPSGSTTGWFQSAATLTDPRDLPYAAPFPARRAMHAYSGTTFHNGKISFYYQSVVGDADVVNHTWTNLRQQTYGAQLNAISASLGTADQYLQDGLAAATDPVTGKGWVTLNSGSAGINARSHLMRIDPATQTIERLVGAPNVSWGAPSLAFVGRELYGVTSRQSPGNPNVSLVNSGFHFDTSIDAPTAKAFTIAGDVPVRPTSAMRQETVPIFSDDASVWMWNYLSEPDALYRVDLTPVGGSGTGADPHVLVSTRIALDASGIPPVALTYKLDYIREWGVVMILPSATTKWWAIKVDRRLGDAVFANGFDGP